MTQIARGAFEAFVPFGWIITASLNSIATVINLSTEISSASQGSVGVNDYLYLGPYPDPVYPLPFWLLHLA